MTDSIAVNWPELFQEQALTTQDERLRAFYEHGTVAGNTPLSDVPFVALDFETTGLDADSDEIISIGLVPFDLNRIRLREARHWLLKPRSAMKDESIVIHGITHTELNDAPDLNRVLGQVLEAIAGRIVVVHYRYIEREFLNAALKKRINEGIGFPVVDTMQLEAMLYRQGVANTLKRLIGKKQESIRLGDSRSRYNLPHYGQHHALTDAISTAELLQAQIRHRYSEITPLSDIWV